MSLELDVRMAASTVLGTEAELLEAYRQETPILNGWDLWMVSDEGYPTQEVFVATRDGAAIVPEFDDGFSRLVDVEPVEIADTTMAIEYAELFVGATRPDMRRLMSLDDVAGVDQEVATQLASPVIPPRARQTDSGFEVEMFLLDDDALVRGTFGIAADGRIESEITEVAAGITIFGGMS